MAIQGKDGMDDFVIFPKVEWRMGSPRAAFQGSPRVRTRGKLTGEARDVVSIYIPLLDPNYCTFQ